MTLINLNADAPRPPSPGIARRIHQWIETAAERWRTRREMAELSRLPRHLLRDMGLEQYAPPRDPAIPLQWR